jgi:pyrophosphatase PpaX
MDRDKRDVVLPPLALFDLDGTLIDTTELILLSFAHTFERHLPGLLPSRERLIASFGRSLPETLTEFAEEFGAPDPSTFGTTLLETYREYQHAHHDRLVRPFAGIRDSLETLSAAGWRLGLVTSKMEGFARRGLALFDLDGYFPVAVFHNDTALHKPDPAPLLLAAERAAIATSAVVYIGDSVHDIVAGRAAGVATGAALWGPFPPEVLRAAGPDFEVPRPSALPAVLERYSSISRRTI